MGKWDVSMNENEMLIFILIFCFEWTYVNILGYWT